MNSHDAIQQELKDLRSSLPHDSKQPVFTVPDTYFENLAASLLIKVKSQTTSAADELEALSPVLAAIPKKLPFSVPEAYFTDLAASLPALANDEALPGFLQTHTKQMPYQVPAGYFEALAAQAAATVLPKAKVISLSPRFMRMAAAAVVAGIIAVAGFVYVAGSRTAIDPAEQPYAWVAEKLKNVPRSDMEAFLKTVDPGFGSKGLAQQGDVRQMLRDVSTTELDAFLSELPADADFSNMN